MFLIKCPTRLCLAKTKTKQTKKVKVTKSKTALYVKFSSFAQQICRTLTNEIWPTGVRAHLNGHAC